jgi:NAD(P)-dependent dehydrogenase (short-subunit alcohol dehydrogenase family)
MIAVVATAARAANRGGKGSAAHDLTLHPGTAGAAESLGARFVALDFTDEASVAAAADVVARAGGLDVFINNAGIVGPRPQVPETTAEDLRITFETNVFGPVRVVRAFTDLLDASAAHVVVNVSSGAGSLGYASDPNGPAADILLLGA